MVEERPEKKRRPPGTSWAYPEGTIVKKIGTGALSSFHFYVNVSLPRLKFLEKPIDDED